MDLKIQAVGHKTSAEHILWRQSSSVADASWVPPLPLARGWRERRTTGANAFLAGYEQLASDDSLVSAHIHDDVPLCVASRDSVVFMPSR
mmetsp:Transcript_3928/g.5397  ORF Transcript_3928/g.5397 Transcript_3928/m.5397 type:complete len:90 (+) Transcript_3928:385-654(+)